MANFETNANGEYTKKTKLQILAAYRKIVKSFQEREMETVFLCQDIPEGFQMEKFPQLERTIKEYVGTTRGFQAIHAKNFGKEGQYDHWTIRLKVLDDVKELVNKLKA